MNTLAKKLSVLGVASFSLALPQVALAQNFGGLRSLLLEIESVINAALPVLAGIALLAFFYGLAVYVFKADDEEGQEKGKQTMIAGIVALFLMAAIGGIVNWMTTALDFGNENVNIENPIR